MVKQEEFLSIQNETTSIFNDNNINHLYFKGSVLCKVYDGPSIRTRGDIDIYVDINDFNKAKNLLKLNKFILDEFEGKDISYFVEYMLKSGIHGFGKENDGAEYVIVSNHKFINHFSEWKNNSSYSNKITVLDDGSTNNDNRLGAVRDIWFAIENANISDDILVLAGDNLLDFSLKGFIDFSNEKNGNAVMRYYESELPRLQRTGVAVIDGNDKILEMAEKNHMSLNLIGLFRHFISLSKNA